MLLYLFLFHTPCTLLLFIYCIYETENTCDITWAEIKQ